MTRGSTFNLRFQVAIGQLEACAACKAGQMSTVSHWPSKARHCSYLYDYAWAWTWYSRGSG